MGFPSRTKETAWASFVFLPLSARVHARVYKDSITKAGTAAHHAKLDMEEHGGTMLSLRAVLGESMARAIPKARTAIAWIAETVLSLSHTGAAV